MTVNLKHVEAMLQVYRSTEFADVVIQDLATLTSPKPRTDLYWRRKEIILKYKVSPARETIAAIYKAFESRGLGKLNINRKAGAHDNFVWKDGVSYVDLAKEVLRLGGKRGNVGPKTAAQLPAERLPAERMPVEHIDVGAESARKPALVLVLTTGRELRLSLDEARDLQDQLKGFIR